MLSQQDNSLTQVTSQNGQTISSLQVQDNQYQSSVVSLQEELSSAAKQIRQTFTTWNVNQTCFANCFLFGTIPDTFDYHDTFTSSVPVDVFYFTDIQFVQWYVNGTNGISGSYTSYLNTMSQSDTFTLGEGCAGYVVVEYFATAGTIYPNVSVTYNPASSATGVCAT
jgi:hypothetical protein